MLVALEVIEPPFFLVCARFLSKAEGSDQYDDGHRLADGEPG